jgi:phage tail-like protein
MDANQTKFHLLYGRDDWGHCRLAGATDTLGALWQAASTDALPEGGEPPASPPTAAQKPALEWDDATGSLRLRRSTPLFRRSGRTVPLRPEQRRGAGRDQYGNWYWIAADERTLMFLARGASKPVPYWSAASPLVCEPPQPGTFACAPAAPLDITLRGLAVTTRHYLVVGDATRGGLLVFDLHGGGAPLLMLWPEETPLDPWDIAPAPGGGVLVLDRENLAYWALDEHFRLLADRHEGEEAAFQPKAGGPRRRAPRAFPQGYPLASGSPPGTVPPGNVPPGPFSPVSIEAGEEGRVLIMDTDPGRDYSLIYQMAGAQVEVVYSLKDAIAVADPALGEGALRLFSVAGHDFVYGRGPVPAGAGDDDGGETAAERPAPLLLYVAERDGQQVMAFELDPETGRVVEKAEYLPLRRWQARALVEAGDEVFYDFNDRWVSLQRLMDCEYAGRAVMTTPAEFPPDLPGAPFDSGEPGCVWHRLVLDAIIPPGTSLTVRARASDDPRLLAQTGWIGQPVPYHRSGGAEVPYFDPWRHLSEAAQVEAGGRAGSWELLFQGVKGRFVELELTFAGTGRSTPALRALRAWYPRFSYLEHYLPAIYREDPTSAFFTERFLANFEGLYTGLEDRIASVSALFDSRTAPADALDWLACWFGIALDPLWPEARRRVFIRHADRLYRQRGTLRGVETALRLYLDDGGGAAAEANLFDPRCQGRVRIIEHFRTRGAGGLAYGDPTDAGTRELRPLTRADVMASAHRFSVLAPHDLTAEQMDMVRRIVELEKPAHSAYVIKRYWDMFRVGEARLGLDTRLGHSSRFTPILLGEAYLPDGYLPAPYPFDIEDRLISDRDRLGDLPAL